MPSSPFRAGLRPATHGLTPWVAPFCRFEVASSYLVLNSHLCEDIGVVEAGFFQAVVAAGGAAVSSGTEIRFQDHRVVVGSGGAHFRDVLGGLPVHDLAIVE